MSQTLHFDPALIQRLSILGPRYTSYPTADRFHSSFTESDFDHLAKPLFQDAGQSRPLSLYVHIPFCNTLCYFCACNKIITKDTTKAEQYVRYLNKELLLQAPLFQKTARVEQLHFGGGTPTFLGETLLTQVMNDLKRTFHFVSDDKGEYSIEIDPRKVQPSTMHLLRTLGFNRISLGVQDFNPIVQKAVNRVQSESGTRSIIKAAKDAGFKSISLDLIYGLPHQTPDTFAQTLEQVIELRPHRLSIYNYAHLPHRVKAQRRIEEKDLPTADQKLDILALTIRMLANAGYVYIGMDHFALPDDELAIAQRAGTLHRNFQGYSTHGDLDLLSFGVSAISKIGASYSQNSRTLEEYYALLDQDRLPLFRGIELNRDDQLRRQLIQRLMCHFQIDLPVFETEWDISFANYFNVEMPTLHEYQTLGLLEFTSDTFRVMPKGRLLVRNIAMVFDRYLREQEKTARYSKVI